MFLIMFALTWNRAMVVSTATMVTISVDARIVGPWFSYGRVGASAREVVECMLLEVTR